MELAKQIQITRKNHEVEVLIDGEEFPWLLDVDGVRVVVDEGVPSVTVTVTILAASVAVVNEVTLSPEPKPKTSSWGRP